MDGLFEHIEETWSTLTAPVSRPTSGEHGSSEGIKPRVRSTEQTPKTKTTGRHRTHSSPDTIMHFRGSTPQHRMRARNAEGPTFLLGVNVQIVNGLVTVRSFVRDSVCEGRLQANDIIHSIDGKPCRSVDALRGACPGAVGSSLRLRFSRPPEPQCRELVFERAVKPCGAGYFCESASASDDSGKAQRKDAHTCERQARMTPEPCSETQMPPQQIPRQSEALVGGDTTGLTNIMKDNKLAVPSELSIANVACQTRGPSVPPDAADNQHIELVDEKIKHLIAVAESIWQTAQQAGKEIAQRSERLSQENGSLRVQLLQFHSVTNNRGDDYQTLLRRNKALENELHALTEDLGDHYVPFTVFQAVQSQLQASAHQNERIVRECDRLRNELSRLQKLPSSGLHISALDASGEETVASGEITARARETAENSESSEFGERGQSVDADERRCWEKERSDLIAEIGRLRREESIRLERTEIKVPPENQDAIVGGRKVSASSSGRVLPETQIATLCPSPRQCDLSPNSNSKTWQAKQASTDTLFKRAEDHSNGENLDDPKVHHSTPFDCENASIMNQSSITGMSRSPCFSSPDSHHLEQRGSGDAGGVEAGNQIQKLDTEAETTNQHGSPELQGLTGHALTRGASESAASELKTSPTIQFSSRKAQLESTEGRELDVGRPTHRHSLADLCSSLSLLSTSPTFESGMCGKSDEDGCDSTTVTGGSNVRELVGSEEASASSLLQPPCENARPAATSSRNKGWFDGVFGPKVSFAIVSIETFEATLVHSSQENVACI